MMGEGQEPRRKGRPSAAPSIVEHMFYHREVGRRFRGCAKSVGRGGHQIAGAAVPATRPSSP